MRYIVVDTEGLVTNIVDWDGETAWLPPEGCSAVQMDNGEIGGTYIDGTFTPPVARTHAATPSLADQIAALQAQLDALAAQAAP